MKTFSPKRRPQPSLRRAAPAASTSWNQIADWYVDHLKERGDYQHDLIFPGTLTLLEPKSGGTYIDLACGEGSFLQGLATQIHRGNLFGMDAAPKLIDHAKRNLQQHSALRGTFLVGDASRANSPLPADTADGVTCLMAIQNIKHIAGVFEHAARILRPNGAFVIVLNHPCFRQPRQSGWGWDEERKLQYRRIDRYKESYEMPIIAHPGSAPSVTTTSYHRPLETYINSLAAAGLIIDRLEEWTSHKNSDSGPRAKAENVARKEIPLFLAIRARKIR